MKGMSAIVAMTALALSSGVPNPDLFEVNNGRPRLREKKNKYNLTPDQIEAMKSMTPKEKKAFLRGLK